MSLQDLSTAPITDKVDFNNLPEQMGGFPPPPPPGPYRFRVPTSLGADHFSSVNSTDWGARVSVNFDDSAPLLIVQSTTGEQNNTPFQTRISNVPRERGKKGSGTFASDFDYLLQALKHQQRPTSNRAYAEALLEHRGQEFSADVEWSWGCNKDKPGRWNDGQGNLVEAPNPATGQPHNGCGTKLYQNDPYIQQQVKANGGVYPLRITCPQCSASVRAFGNLQRFRE